MSSTAQILILVLWTLGGILVFLSLSIVINKARREHRARKAGRLITELESKILGYVNGQGERLAPQLPHLDRFGRRVVEEFLLDHARFLKGFSRERITKACEELGFVSARILQLGNSRWWKRSEAAEKLGMMMSPRAARELIPLLEDPIPEVRMRAAKALGRLQTRTSIRPLIETLRDPSRWSALRVADIISGMGVETADELVATYDSLPGKAKVAVVDCLGRAKSLKAARLMIHLLSDPDPDIRARAAHAMGLLGDPNLTPDLVAALHDPAWPVRAMAAKALGKLRRSQAVEPLSRALKDKEWWVRINAAEGLRSVGERGLAALVAAIDSEDRFARQAAVSTLEGAGILDQYVDKLGSPDRVEREKGLALIRKIVAAERTDQLIQTATQHAQQKVREQLSQILQRREATEP